MFHHRGADGHVLCGQPQAIIDAAGGVADLQLQIPQHIQHGFDDAFRPGRSFVGRQKQQIDIGLRCHFGAAIAANGQDSQLFRLGRRAAGVQMRGGDVVDGGDDGVGQAGNGAHRFPRGAGVATEACDDVIHGGAAGRLQGGDGFGPDGAGIGGRFQPRVQFRQEGRRVEYGMRPGQCRGALG